jgi:uncharacterized protein YqjF (DUF2071 family)
MTCAIHTTDGTRGENDGLTLNAGARHRMLSQRGEPLFLADWMRVLMMHFEVDAAALQRHVPYALDLYDGHAFVTLVAFTMENMHPRRGGKLAAWVLRPIASHDFLNVRTYVRHNGEPGIHFLAEWLSNWLAVQLGPRSFSLPYRHGRFDYEHDWRSGQLGGRAEDVQTRAVFQYRADLEIGAPLAACECGSRDEWLMERYAAFNAARGGKRFFRVWHPSWPQVPAAITIQNRALLEANWPWFKTARLIGGNFSPGLKEVWMGRPHRA